jgi:hypothetical protein
VQARRSRLSRGPVGLVLDVVSVLVFVAIGRSVHTRGVTLAGMASTSWPFLVGMAAGWLAARAWRRPTAILPTGLAAWLGSVAVGQILRVLSGQGTAFPFILVTLGFLGVTMLGWRLLSFALARLSTTVAPHNSPT